MAEIKINGKTVVTQTGSAEPEIGGNVLMHSNAINTALSGATFPAGHIVKTQGYTNSTRLVVGTTTDETLWSGISYTKLYNNTNLVLTGHIQQRGGWFFALRYRFIFTNSGNSSTTNYDGFVGHTDTAQGGTNSGSFARAEPINLYITDQVSGVIDMELHYQNENGVPAQPGQINPNSSDDARWPQTKSTLIIYEIMT